MEVENNNLFYNNLKVYLNAEAVSAERFRIMEDTFHVDLLTFEDRPFIGVRTVISNGVSNLKFRLRAKGDELIFSYYPKTVEGSLDINAFLITYIQLHYLKNPGSVSYGNFFLTEGPILKGYNFRGIYTTRPVYFPPDFEDKNPSVNFLWLVPIFESEYFFLKKNGRNKFEEILEELDPDLTKLDREPII